MPAGATYFPIATTTLGSAQSSYTFSSIPSTYTDLVLIVNGSMSALQNIGVEFNGNSGTNYSFTRIYGDGSSAFSDTVNNLPFSYLGIMGTTQSNLVASIQNYANTTTFKTSLGRGNATTSGYVSAYVSTWRSTAAITSVKVLPAGANTLSSGMVITLYGIASA
jgi:hypothetical protein